ncbi:hypothetical protein V2G26_000715 [Clonostachys chloroleuca]
MDHQTPDADVPPPMSRVKQNRIDIWRNEVAALTLDTALDTSDDPSRHSPPPSSATSSASSSSSFLSLSSPTSRGRRFWRRLSHRLTGRPLDPSPPDVARTDMYRTEQQQSSPSPRHTAPKDLGRRHTAEAALGEESSRDGLQGALGAKQDRLERAARLLEEGPVRE